MQPIPAFSDNYIWMSADGGQRLVVDPGEAAPVLAALEAADAQPAAILLTHHHDDHIGGVAALLQRWPDVPVHAPEEPRIDLPVRRVVDGDTVDVEGWRFQVMAVPGHTVSHIAYRGHHAGQDWLFCGDTLFSLGCGRMFEGTPEQFLASLDALAALPGDTRVCCAHEYTLSNGTFAQHVDPDNPALAARIDEARRQRAAGEPTLPTTLAQERASNPFLRVDTPAIRAALAARMGRVPASRVEAFAELRRWKDGFRA